jgi:hypothetical protein
MATASPPKPKKRKSSIRDLFFLKRRPHLRGVSMEWEPPPDDAAYQKLLNDEGFVSNDYWKDDDINNHPIIAQDLADLEQYLLSTFFEFSQKSKYFQNQFYLFQWVFIWGAFLTTVLGALASIFYYLSSSATGTVEAGLSTQQLFSYLTAIVGAITAFITALSNRGEPLKRWGKTRRLAEELRMNYFNYLSHLPPFDKPDRVQKLRESVIDIRVKEQENA